MKLKTSFKIMIVSSILLPALIVGGVGTVSYANFYSDMVSEESATAAYSEVKAQTLFFERYSSRLSAIAQLEQVKRAAGGDYTAIKEQVDAVVNSQTDSALLDTIIMDNGGLVVANSKSELNILQKQFDGYNDTLAATDTDGIYISSVTLSTASTNKYGTDVIYIVKPMISSTGSVGYVAAVTDARQLAASVQSAGFFNGTGSIMLIDGDYNVLDVSGIHKEDASSVDAPRELLSGLSETARYASFSGGGYYGAIGAIDNSDWIWVGKCSASATTFTVVPAIFFGILIFAIFIVLDSVLAFGIYRRAITPLGKIAGVMEEINAGDRQKRLPRFKTYEYQVISEAFNGLLDDFYISEDVHRTVSELSESMLFEWDLERGKMYVSDNFKNLFDINIENADLFDGSFIDSLMSEKDARHFRKDMGSLINEREYAEGEYQVRTLRNTEIWINIKAQSYTKRTGTGEVARIIGVITDINNKKKSSLQLSQKASYDFLSQLYNRSTFLKELQKLLDLKRVNESYAVMFIDVDDFKFINDRYGHNVGDEVIKYVADTLKSCVGGNGIAGRFGGDEYVLCITNTEIVTACEDFAANLIDRLYSGYRCEGVDLTLNVKASIGITIVSEQVSDAERLVGEADEAMYFVKKNGKANFHFYDPSAAPTLDLGNTIT